MPRTGRTPTGHAVREIGDVLDVNGARITVTVDCDGVKITGPKETMLGPAEREAYMRLLLDAEWAAENWAKNWASVVLDSDRAS
jgi:hypothetical protein